MIAYTFILNDEKYSYTYGVLLFILKKSKKMRTLFVYLHIIPFISY